MYLYMYRSDIPVLSPHPIPLPPLRHLNHHIVGAGGQGSWQDAREIHQQHARAHQQNLRKLVGFGTENSRNWDLWWIYGGCTIGTTGIYEYLRWMYSWRPKNKGRTNHGWNSCGWFPWTDHPVSPVEQLVGGFKPCEKYIKYESHLGWLFPIHGKIIQMFQTTKQTNIWPNVVRVAPQELP